LRATFYLQRGETSVFDKRFLESKATKLLGCVYKILALIRGFSGRGGCGSGTDLISSQAQKRSDNVLIFKILCKKCFIRFHGKNGDKRNGDRRN
jgi:hypothetical protein